MFTKPPYHGPAGLGFVNNASYLRAEWLNYVGGILPNALDAVGGGYYQLTGADLRISSNTREIKINSPAIAKPTSFRGFVTIGVTDDANYPTGLGALTVEVPAEFTDTVTFGGAMTFDDTVTFNGAVTFTTDGDITLESGCTVTGESGSSLTMAVGSAFTASGTNAIGGTTTISNTATISATTTVSGTISLSGRRQLRRARVVLSDADQSVDVADGDRFVLPANNASPRTIELTSTSIVPFEGECLEFLWTPGGAGGSGTQYTFEREDSTVVATFVGSTTTDTGAVYAEFEFTSGVWRLGKSSGTINEYTPGPDTWTPYGVVPGAGA